MLYKNKILNTFSIYSRGIWIILVFLAEQSWINCSVLVEGTNKIFEEPNLKIMLYLNNYLNYLNMNIYFRRVWTMECELACIRCQVADWDWHIVVNPTTCSDTCMEGVHQDTIRSASRMAMAVSSTCIRIHHVNGVSECTLHPSNLGKNNLS